VTKAAPILIGLCAFLFAFEAQAQTCDQEAAAERWDAGTEAELILGVSMLNGKPTIHMERFVWRAMDLNTRLGVISTFQCLLTEGQGRLSEVIVISENGVRLARWDGIRETFEADE